MVMTVAIWGVVGRRVYRLEIGLPRKLGLPGTVLAGGKLGPGGLGGGSHRKIMEMLGYGDR